jgi:uncharacterized protein (DUF2164 family)
MIELTKENRTHAIASIRQYAERNLPEPLGDLAAGLLLDFFLTDIAPLVYNQGITDAATRLHQRLEDLEGELHEHPFTYWTKQKHRPR